MNFKLRLYPENPIGSYQTRTTVNRTWLVAETYDINSFFDKNFWKNIHYSKNRNLTIKKNLFPGFPIKFIPIPGEWGIPGILQVLGFLIPIPAIPGIPGKGTGIPGNFSFPAHLCSVF